MVYVSLSKQLIHSDDYSSLLGLSDKETLAQELYQRMCLDEEEGRVIFEMKEVNWFYVGHLILCGLIRVMM